MNDDRPLPSVLHYESLDSTNEEAHRLLKAGAKPPFWIVADEQTRGRGRGGRVWRSPKGNLYATYVMATPVELTAAAELSFVAAVAAHDGILQFAAPSERERLRLKWPNDVLLGRAKVAGVLLESVRTAQSGLTIVLGIGVNVSHAPEGTGREVACLGLAPDDVRAVFDALSRSIAYWLAVWDQGSAFAVIREAWLARAFGLGTPVSVHLHDKVLRGTFRGIDAGGALQLETAPGVVVSVTAGDIYPDLSV